jgi:hypothetical protein
MEAVKRFTARLTRRTEPNGRVHFASVTVVATPTSGPTAVLLAEEVLNRLREWFGEHFEHGRHCLASGVVGQIAMANVAGEMPAVGRASFLAEVVAVELDSELDWETSGTLLCMAAMDAIVPYLLEFEHAQSVTGAASDSSVVGSDAVT